jgi:hypothetical protein
VQVLALGWGALVIGAWAADQGWLAPLGLALPRADA